MSKPENAKRLGPWSGGINTYSNPAFVLDDEVVDLVNLEPGFDQVLRNRPPIVELEVAGISSLRTFNVIGIASFSNGLVLLVGSEFASSFVPNVVWTLPIQDGGEGWRFVESATSGLPEINSKVGLMYNDEFWVIPVASPSIDQGDIVSYIFNVAQFVAAGPRGNTAVIFKDRLWVGKGINDKGAINGSRVFFSEPGDPGTFLSSSFFDVNPGDGTNVTAIIVYQDSLYIFKERSTWQFSFDADPADGTLRQINTVIGTDNYKCLTSHENSLFCYQGSDIYEVVNNQFIKINPRVTFDKGPPLPDGDELIFAEDKRHLSIIGDRLICRYFGNTYVYNLRTRTWSRWQIRQDINDEISRRNWFADWFKSPNFDENGLAQYFTVLGMSGIDYELIATPLRIKDGHTINDREMISNNFFVTPVDIECRVLTKQYDLDSPFQIKKINWWGADVVSNRDVSTKIIFTGLGKETTWGTLESMTWADWEDTPYWTYEENGQAIVSDTKSLFTNNLKGFVRFLESVTGALFQFEITADTNGKLSSDGGLFQVRDVILTSEEGQVAIGKVL